MNNNTNIKCLEHEVFQLEIGEALALLERPETASEYGETQEYVQELRDGILLDNEMVWAAGYRAALKRRGW